MPFTKSITKVWKECAVCSTTFLTKRSLQDRVITCSVKCGGQYRSAKTAVRLTCLHCSTVFSAAPSSRRNINAAYCSISCSAKASKRSKVYEWRVGTDGYVYKTRNGRKVFQHREVMETYLGRPLTDKENVHHLNGDRSDNRIENLELWNHSQPKGQRLDDKLGAAKKLLEEHGYIVHNPMVDFASGVLYGAAPHMFN